MDYIVRGVTKSWTQLINFHFTSINPGLSHLKNLNLGFPGGPVVKNLPTKAGDMGSTGLGGFHIPQSN